MTTETVHRWPLPAINGYSNDIDHFEHLFEVQATRWGLQEVELGSTGHGMISLWQSVAANKRLPHVLLAAGFHGDEPAGSWGLLNFLQHNSPLLLDKICLTFLPLVNFSGMRNGQRLTAGGRDMAKGYGVEPPASEEADLLQASLPLLKEAARDGLLCCGEALEAEHAWLYSWEPGGEPDAFSLTLRDELAECFPLHSDALLEGCRCREGIIHNYFDDSFAAWLVAEGAAVAARIKTPGKASFEQRIFAHHMLTSAFISAVINRMS
ncbi:hypothetical protein MT962_002492 [Franconibacter sp. IITDAS19]|uniref:hypothetical protein n=1 Tax=Franconibacter sp. IITDAS19 TaxID=2930569 RepID=UPI001FF7EB30|nr:hypothetical protein [Franconibacter sp. IITDAS19]MCK1968659.1 hypothetical protein [Franconibacter sp. IITDAS19]